MATRPAFFIDQDKVISKDYTFKWYPGFAISQKQKTIASLHAAIIEADHSAKPLEVSTKSNTPLGVKLSGFNLKVDGRPIENAFESSKVFEHGGPYLDLLDVEPKDAKRDPRLVSSGDLIAFRYQDRDFPITPRTAFYDFLYITGAKQSLTPEELTRLGSYNYFTDIEVDPKKRIDTQARGAALLKLILSQYGEVPTFTQKEFIEYHKAHVLA